ncbi:MAG: hypothetical protein J6112_03590 [Clostridia bacterium]|nr:hypothetical protein [Clostridia bacterium]
MSKEMHHMTVGDETFEVVDAAARSDINSTSADLNAQRARIDNIASLDEGSTTGDAELIDIRVGADGTTYSSAGDAVRGQFGEIQNYLTNQNKVVLINHTDDVGTSAMVSTRRWFLPDVIPADSFVGTVKYRTASSISGTIEFEIWEKDGDSLTLVKSVSSTPVKSSVNSVPVNYKTETDCMIGWKAVGGTSFRSNNGTYDFLMYASSDLSSDELSYASLDKTAFPQVRPCAEISYTRYSLKRLLSLPSNVVTIGENMDYEEIQDALLAISDDSVFNPYTLLVMPKGTPYQPFTMLRDSFSDSYPWSGIAPRYISIIGLDKAHCIIRSNSGDYKYPCGEPLTNGVIKNLTFVMTNDQQTETATQGGYCLHIDSKPLDNVGYKMLIEDCDFEDASGPCLGIGVHINCDLQIRRCRFNTTLVSNYSPHEGYRNLSEYGVVYCHSSTSENALNQRFTLEDCVGVCAEGNKGLRIDATTQYSPQTSSFIYTLIRNVFWNKAAAVAGYSISGSLTANPMNFGNNN